METQETPAYWKHLKEYVEEAEHEENVPETIGEFLKDFTVYWNELVPELAVRTKVFTPEEADLLGNELYGHLEIAEDVEFNLPEDGEEKAATRHLRELVQREWVPL